MFYRPICLLLLLSASVYAAEPKQAIVESLKQLADRNPQVRDKAGNELMALDQTDLPLLRQVIAKSPQLKVSQIAALYDIVCYLHVRSAMLKLPKMPNGFLGVSLPSTALTDTRNEPAGFAIVSRLNGFVGFRKLQDGDVITAVGLGDDLQPVSTPAQFQTIIRSYAAGQRISLRVMRGIVPMTIQLNLDAAPQLNDAGAPISDIILDAEIDAEKYWETNFTPLIATKEI